MRELGHHASGGVTPRWVMSAVASGRRALGQIEAASKQLAHCNTASVQRLPGAQGAAAMALKSSAQIGTMSRHAARQPLVFGERAGADSGTNAGPQADYVKGAQTSGQRLTGPFDRPQRASDPLIQEGLRVGRPSLAPSTGSGAGGRWAAVADGTDRAPAQPVALRRDGGAGEATRRVLVTMGTTPAVSHQEIAPVARQRTEDGATPPVGARGQRGFAAAGAVSLAAMAAAGSRYSRPFAGGIGGPRRSGPAGGMAQAAGSLRGPGAPVAVALRQAAIGGGAAPPPGAVGDGITGGVVAATMPLVQAATASGGAGPAAGGGPTEGDVYLDGTLVGRWMARSLARAAGRPASGGAAFDPTRNRLPFGAMIGA